VAGDHAEGLRVGRHGLAIAEGLPDRGAEIGLLIRLGHLLHARGDLGEAETVLRRSLALLAEGSPYEHQVLNAIPSVQARTWLAWCLADLGDLEEALSQTEEARRTADSREQPYSVVMATWGLGYCHLVSGRVADAVTAFAASLDLCRAWNNAHWTPRATAGLGYARALSGSVDEGIRLLEEGTSGLDRIGLRACSPLFLTWLGEAYLSAGRWRDAAQSARRAADRARVQGERGLEAYAARLVAQVEQSEPQYHAVIELASSLGMRPLADRCRQELAGLQPSGVERRVDESTRTRPLPGPALRAESV
jgi:tetratricopeptide (TPR) repeat protein